MEDDVANNKRQIKEIKEYIGMRENLKDGLNLGVLSSESLRRQMEEKGYLTDESKGGKTIFANSMQMDSAYA